MQIFQFIELPFCKVLMVESWNAPAHRFFIAYTARGDYRHVLGLPVIDEYATFSSPIFFAPIPLLGKIYNAGISLAHLRDPDMGMETGWPPLCIGVDDMAPGPPADWEQALIKRLQSAALSPPEPELSGKFQIASVDGFSLQRIQIGKTTVFATDAPLLPRQLRRISQAANTPFAVAFATGNRIISKEDSSPLMVQSASEEMLHKVMDGFSGLKASSPE